MERCLASSVVARLRDYEGQVVRPTLSGWQRKTWGYGGQAVLVLERLKRLPEVEASPDFKISLRTRCRPRSAFRIEHEHEKILAKRYRIRSKIRVGSPL